MLSREAVRLFVEQGLRDPAICRSDPGGHEDVGMGKCLENLNVKAGDSRDSQGRNRFFPFDPETHLVPDRMPNWYWDYTYCPVKPGRDCCSDMAVSFHYVNPNQMYVLDYLIYNVHPFGITTSMDQGLDGEFTG